MGNASYNTSSGLGNVFPLWAAVNGAATGAPKDSAGVRVTCGAWFAVSESDTAATPHARGACVLVTPLDAKTAPDDAAQQCRRASQSACPLRGKRLPRHQPPSRGALGVAALDQV
jgi:hypothetical protein